MEPYLEEKFKLHEPSWQSAYPKLSKIINRFDFQFGAEVGVAFGGHSEAILKNTRINKLYSIDRFKHDPSYIDPLNYTDAQFDQLFEFVKNRLSVFGDRCELLRMESSKASEITPNELDFVYIDADHSYEGVFRDLCTWSKKIRYGGIIAGHDYGHAQLPGVKKAIDEFFTRFDWKINEEGEGVWWVEKRPLNISFIIPAYNCSNTICETLDSIFNDNYKDGDEIIIIDDRSTDNTVQTVLDYQVVHPGIQVISHKINKGTAAASRNTGIENSKNPLIFCIDSDNILEKKSINKLSDHLFNSGAWVAAFGELWFFSESIKHITHKWLLNSKIEFADALSGWYWPGPSGNYLFTKSSWIKAGRYFEPTIENQTIDSWAFGIRQLGTGQKMVTLPGLGYYHRYGHESHYVRNSQKGNISLAALIGLIPFLDQIEESDIDYVFSKKGREHWYENLQFRPLTIKGFGKGNNGRIVYLDKNLENSSNNQPTSFLRKILRKLFLN